MNIAFKIPPASQQYADMHLIAEAGKDEISFLVFSKNPFVAHGFYVYSFKKHIGAAEYAECLQKIFHSEHGLQQPFASCHIFYNGNESVLVPAAYFSEPDAPGICDLMFGEDRTSLCFHENVKGQDIKNVYRVPQKIHEALNTALPGHTFSHATSSQLDRTAWDFLQCIVYHNNIKFILTKEGKSALVRYAEYSSPADVCWCLLNACAQFGLATDSVQLQLSGMIDEHSNLYKDIYRYFVQVSFSTLPGEISVEPKLAEQPHHFYSHLISLAQCV